MNTFVSHPSVRIKGTENNYEPSTCIDPKCGKSWPHMHCPFCIKSEKFQDPVILKAHYRVKHVDKGIEFAGLKILRCCEHCDIIGTIKGTKEFKGAHWHCYKCRNGFTRRDEAIKHYRTHFRNPSTTFQIQVSQDLNQLGQSPDREACNAVDGLPTEMTLIETVVTSASIDSSGLTSVVEQIEDEEEGTKSTSGEIQVSVAANETVGTCEGQTIMIVPSVQGGEVVGSLEAILKKNKDFLSISEGVQADISTTANSNTYNTNWRQEKLVLEEEVKNLKIELVNNNQLLEQLRGEIDSLKVQLQMSAADVSAYQKREAELLSHLKIPVDDRLSGLLSELKQQHEDLLHQQLAQVRHSYLQQQLGEDFGTMQRSLSQTDTVEVRPDKVVEMDMSTLVRSSLVRNQVTNDVPHMIATVEENNEVVLAPENYATIPDSSINAGSIVLTSQSLMSEGNQSTQLFMVPATLHAVKSENMQHSSASPDMEGEFHEDHPSTADMDYSKGEEGTSNSDGIDQKIILLQSAVDGSEVSPEEYSEKSSHSLEHIETEILEVTTVNTESDQNTGFTFTASRKRGIDEDACDGGKSKQRKEL